MATLSDTQIASVKKHLEYSGLATNQEYGFGSSAFFNQEAIDVEISCKNLADEATKTQVIGILTQLDNIQTQMSAEMQNAGLDQVSDIRFSSSAYQRLMQFYDFHRGQLRALLRLDSCHNPDIIPTRRQW